jgi:hypothetical protein
MGQSKRAYQMGYLSIDNRVCNHCANDVYIKKFIKDNGEDSFCDYCNKNRKKTVYFNDFIEFFLQHFDSGYGYPNDEFVHWDDGESFEINELLDKISDFHGIDYTNIPQSLQDDIIDSLSDRRWCEKPYWQYDLSEALKYGWEGFVRLVKHKSRYVFNRIENEFPCEPIPPSAFLDELGKLISRLGLYKTLTKGTFLYRARIHDSDRKKKLIKASDLAPPTIEYAKYSNRMSPAGIPMFYGAYDICTALKETYDLFNDQGKVATVAKFKLLKDICLVDLSKVPPIPGFFEDASYSYHEIVFLNDFVVDISKDIKKDGREHIEYVPTQIVTEYLRFLHNNETTGRIYGLIYPSSKNKGKKSVVIFCKNEHCVEKGEANDDSLFEMESLRRINPDIYIKN